MIYGLIGKDIKHSCSPEIHKKIGGYEYSIIEMDSAADFEEFVAGHDELSINVTSPYKETAYKLCDEFSAIASSIGAVNTIVKKDGAVYGDNTDFYGFNFALGRTATDLRGRKVLILGSGGSAKMAAVAAARANCRDVKLMSRYPDASHIDGFDVVSYDDYEAKRGADVLINTIPAGQLGGMAQAINFENFPRCKFVFDLNYNPFNSDIVLSAKERGIRTENGMAMLVAQAYKAALRFGTVSDFSRSQVEKTVAEMIRNCRNIVFIGMGGVGKTTTARMLAEENGMDFIDSDAKIRELHHRSPSEMISEDGEPAFRKIEADVLRSLLGERGKVISLGGGAILHEDIIREFRRNSIMVFLDMERDKLSRRNRPLYTDDAAIERIYAERIPLYRKYSDVQLYARIGKRRMLERLMRI